MTKKPQGTLPPYMCQHTIDRLVDGKELFEVMDMDKKIGCLISERNKIAETVISICEPEIAAVCHLFEKGEQVSEQTIERLFDRLLEHCYNDEVVKLFNELCQVAVTQHPQLVQDYIRYYKEQWE